MTFGFRNIIGVLKAKPVSAVIFTGYDSWSPFTRKMFDYVSTYFLLMDMDMIRCSSQVSTLVI